MTIRVALVRHGEPTSDWTGTDRDPGLTALGHEQAAAAVRTVTALGLERVAVIASPLRRTRETAAAFERAWSTSARIEHRVAEVPTDPTVIDAPAAARRAWLNTVMTQPLAELSPALQAWRSGILEAIDELEEDTVIVSHYVAINAAIGAASGTADLISFRPAHCACTLIEVVGGQIDIVALGAETAPAPPITL